MGVARDSYPREGSSKSYVAAVRRSRGRRRDRRLPRAGHPGRGRRRHGHPSAQSRRPDSRRQRCSGWGMPSARNGSTTSITACRSPGASIRPGRRQSWTRRRRCDRSALDTPDPETPVGARGVGEAPVGAGFGAVVNAIAAAVGDEVFKRSPVTADMILTALEEGRVDARAADRKYLTEGHESTKDRPRKHENTKQLTRFRFVSSRFRGFSVS